MTDVHTRLLINRVAELERKMGIVFKYLEAHDKLFKAMDEKADINKDAFDILMTFR